MDLKESPEKDDGSTETTADDKSYIVSTQCKACKKHFTQSTILKHITQKPSCKIAYNQKEIQLHQKWSKEEHNSKRQTQLRKSYNPAKRRERHLKEQKEKIPLKSREFYTSKENPIMCRLKAILKLKESLS